MISLPFLSDGLPDRNEHDIHAGYTSCAAFETAAQSERNSSALSLGRLRRIKTAAGMFGSLLVCCTTAISARPATDLAAPSGHIGDSAALRLCLQTLKLRGRYRPTGISGGSQM
jgi:hypothetical protein